VRTIKLSTFSFFERTAGGIYRSRPWSKRNKFTELRVVYSAALSGGVWAGLNHVNSARRARLARIRQDLFRENRKKNATNP